MLDVFYHPISINEELFELVKDKHQHKSFIVPRKKPSKNSSKIWLTILSIIAIGLIAYLTIPINDLLNENRKKIQEQTVEVKKKFKLPNHIEKNLIAKKRVQDIFDYYTF